MEIQDSDLRLPTRTERVGPGTLKICLDYLHSVALANDLPLVGHLIGVAAQACREEQSFGEAAE